MSHPNPLSDKNEKPEDVASVEIRDRRGQLGCGLLGGLPPTLLGTYLIFDNTWLAFRDGVTEQRVGTIARAEEPGLFWSSVLFDTTMGLLVMGCGLLVLFVFLGENRPVRSLFLHIKEFLPL